MGHMAHRHGRLRLVCSGVDVTDEEALAKLVKAVDMSMPVGVGPKVFKILDEVLDHMNDQGYNVPKLSRWSQRVLNGEIPKVYKP